MKLLAHLFLLSIFAAATVSVPSPAHSAADLQRVVSALEQTYGSLTDIQADFSQTTVIASVNRKERGGGEMLLKLPKKSVAMFRFNYTKPKQQIVSNGKTVWYYTADSNQVIVSDVATLFEGGKGVAFNYLAGIGHVSRDFTITFAGSGRDGKGNYVLNLVPKQKSAAFSKLQLTVDRKAVERSGEDGKAEAGFPIISSVVFDPIGNTTTMEFRNVKVDRGIGSDRFKFKIPPGAEVIRQ